jgi:hypothetical protein
MPSRNKRRPSQTQEDNNDKDLQTVEGAYEAYGGLELLR